MELVKQKLRPATIYSWLQGLISYFSVKTRLVFWNCFFWEYSEPQHLFTFAVCTFEHEAKNSLMLLIMLLLLVPHSGFSCTSCLLQWACIPSSYIFHNTCEQTLYSVLSFFAFFLIVQCFKVQAVNFVIFSLCALSCTSDIPVIPYLWLLPSGAYSLTVVPFHSRHLLLDHSQNLGIASNCFQNTSISFSHLLSYPFLLYSTWSL